MCDGCSQTEAVNEKNYADAGLSAAQIGGAAQGQIKSSSFRDRLESRRNSLTRQLTQVEQALQLLYTNPDAEKIHEVLKRTGVI